MLRGIRRPARHVEHAEARAHPAVGVAECGPVALGGRHHRGAPRQSLASFDDGVCLAHGAQIAKEAKGIGIIERDRLGVDDRKRETRALQKIAGGARVGKRRDAWAQTPFLGLLGPGEGCAQFGQGSAAEHRGREQPVGLERRPDLDERAGKVVDPVQA